MRDEKKLSVVLGVLVVILLYSVMVFAAKDDIYPVMKGNTVEYYVTSTGTIYETVDGDPVGRCDNCGSPSANQQLTVVIDDEKTSGFTVSEPEEETISNMDAFRNIRSYDKKIREGEAFVPGTARAKGGSAIPEPSSEITVEKPKEGSIVTTNGKEYEYKEGNWYLKGTDVKYAPEEGERQTDPYTGLPVVYKDGSWEYEGSGTKTEDPLTLQNNLQQEIASDSSIKNKAQVKEAVKAGFSLDELENKNYNINTEDIKARQQVNSQLQKLGVNDFTGSTNERWNTVREKNIELAKQYDIIDKNTEVTDANEQEVYEAVRTAVRLKQQADAYGVKADVPEVKVDTKTTPVLENNYVKTNKIKTKDGDPVRNADGTFSYSNDNDRLLVTDDGEKIRFKRNEDDRGVTVEFDGKPAKRIKSSQQEKAAISAGLTRNDDGTYEGPQSEKYLYYVDDDGEVYRIERDSGTVQQGVKKTEGDVSWHSWEKPKTKESKTSTSVSGKLSSKEEAKIKKQIKEKEELIGKARAARGQPLKESEKAQLRKYDKEQIQDYITASKKLQSVSGNPDEIYKSCGKSCNHMDIEFDENGKVLGRLAVKNENGEWITDGPTIDTGYQVFCDSGSQCQQNWNKGDEKEAFYSEGAVVVDKEGNRYESKGYVYEVTKGKNKGKKIDGKGKTPEEALEACQEAAGKEGGCELRSKGREATHYYWTPSSWSDFLQGGPATNMVRSLSNLHPKWADMTGTKKWLNRWFNLEQWATTDLCLRVHDVAEKGVGVNPTGIGISTAHISAAKSKIEPCDGMSGSQLTGCLEENNLSSSKPYYWGYRITGMVVPKDCRMKFNIEIDGEDMYEEDIELERGGSAFNFLGANAIVTQNKEIPDDADTICLNFDGVPTWCLATGTKPRDAGGKICNSIADLESLEVTIDLEDDAVYDALAEEDIIEPVHSEENCRLC